MIKDIQKRAANYEKSSEKLVEDLTYKLQSLAKTNSKKAIDEFSKALNWNAEEVRKDW
ncbi:MAG: hypothetical protein LBG23_00555 [Endomicrobium sp.]|jgi:hypothetical protein|nr:hypothetical protein [Endomicrobium sp.]